MDIGGVTTSSVDMDAMDESSSDDPSKKAKRSPVRDRVEPSNEGAQTETPNEARYSWTDDGYVVLPGADNPENRNVAVTLTDTGHTVDESRSTPPGGSRQPANQPSSTKHKFKPMHVIIAVVVFAVVVGMTAFLVIWFSNDKGM